MPGLNFFTPITYAASPTESVVSNLLELVDNYFYLGGKTAHVIQGHTKNGYEKVVLSESDSSLLARVGKVLSYFTVVIPLFMLFAKITLRSTHNFKLIDPKQKLEKGIDISEEVLAQIQDLFPKILNAEEDDRIVYLKGSKIFRLDEHPNLVFKLGISSSSNGKTLHKGEFLDEKEIMEDRFNNMVKAKEVCLINNLGLLVIPHAKKLAFTSENGEQCVLIAEESMDINHKESAQKEFYYSYSKELNETVRQLAIFISETGFNDVTPRNIPILNEDEDFQEQPRRVALIDLEHMESCVNGFTGQGMNGSCGLLRCVAEEQIDIVIAEAGRKGITISDDNKNQRLEEIAYHENLKLYHEENGVVTGKEPILVDLNLLGLDLTEEGIIQVIEFDENGVLKPKEQIVTMGQVVEDIVNEINKRIQEKSDQESMQAQRCMVLKGDVEPFSRYSFLGRKDLFYSKEEKQEFWLIRIFKAISDNGYIFDLRNEGLDHFIQV